ncbi:unnamed protein product [Brachionus calyciflorus]|uniref:Uncharacterized protein n=1 Tax=Brachionus calyciflorus TaxID=104777 RepID=A0A813QRB9_9BILA|nr:unnamed protein product [Brachionus calyciflorus]
MVEVKFFTIRTGRGRGVRLETVYVKPLYEIALWNVHSRIKDCLPRTNNFVEAWHNVTICNAFSNMLVSHPSVYNLVDMIRKEQKKSEENIVKLETGVQYKRKPKYILLDERIIEILKTYSLDNFEKFYDNLSSGS